MASHRACSAHPVFSVDGSNLAVVAPGPSLVAVKPVIDGGGVGLRAVEEVGAEALGGQVASGVEHAPPHVATARWRSRGRRHRRGRGRRRRLTCLACS